MNIKLPVSLDQDTIKYLANQIADQINITKDDDIVKSATNSRTIISINEICKLFAVSRVTIYKWRCEGRIPYKKVKRRVYFILEDVLDSMNSFNNKSLSDMQNSLINAR
ncbi:hypothetical protein MASR1M45_02130 [Candidatus Kapaibacterium sp.]